MVLENYYSQQAGRIVFSRQQGSGFAKEIAKDFNPIHDEDAKRFCVPGDLLFALVLNKYGLSQHMRFNFSGMVAADVQLAFPDDWQSRLVISDDKEKEYLSVERSGQVSQDQAVINSLIQCYVEFSGQTFPHILVPLMQEHHVMINPDRPLVVYESMMIDMQSLEFAEPQLKFTGATLDVEGKRGTSRFAFEIHAGGELVGKGEKSIVLSGMREYDQAGIDMLVERYNAHKESFLAG